MNSGSVVERFVKVFENEKWVNVTDHVEFIQSLINLDINNKRNINALLRYYKNAHSEILIESSKKISDIIEKTLKYLNLDSPVSVFSNKTFTEEELLKALNISIEEYSNNLLERVSNYIDLLFELRKVKWIIFYELSSFLEDDEIELLLKNCNYKGISIINIENDINKTQLFKRKKILDKDCCLIE